MQPGDFTAPSAGKLVTTPEGYWAFVPAFLPPKLEWDHELVLLLSQADAALSELAGLGRLLPNPHLLIGPLLQREAISSSRIEGTRTTLSDLLLDEAEKTEPPSSDIREVRNYIAAMEHGMRRLAELPISSRLVKELHEKLMRGVRGDQATPGEFRRSQNWIGPTGSTAATASYVPPPPVEIPGLLANWESFVNERGKWPELIQCALIHEQFEAIHPFLDGNGRIGRLLITLFLIEKGRLTQPLLYLSDFIEHHKQDYYQLLQTVRTRGDWNGWIRFFLTGILETARDAARRSSLLLELQRDYRLLLAGTPNLFPLIDALFKNPYVSIAQAMRYLDASHPTASKAIQHLSSQGILREITGRRRGRLYVASKILQTLKSEASP